MSRLHLKFWLQRDDFRLDVNAAIPDHGVTGVFGPSGSGKTSLLRCIAGLEPTDDRTPTHRRRIAYVSQQPSLFPHMSVEANIIVNDAKGVVLVPAEAIVDGRVEILDGRRVVKRSVEMGIRGTRLVEIRKGVEEGEHVISPYVPGLEDGARVRTRPAASE